MEYPKSNQTEEQEKVLPKEDDFLVQTTVDDLLREQELQEQQEKELARAKNAEDNQKQKLDEVEQSVSKQSSKKSKIINLVFFFVNIAIVIGILVYQFSKENFVSLKGIKLDVFHILLAILFFAAVVAAETISLGYLLKVSTGKWRLGTAYKVTQIGKYYDSVQPFQISYLKSRGIPLHNSLSIPLAKYVFGQISWVLISLTCLIVSFVDQSYGTFVSIMSIIGFVLSFIVLSATIFLSVCKTIGKKLVVRILKLLHKLKIVKDYDKQYEKIIKYISDFQDVMKQYTKSPKDFTVMLFFSLCVNLFRYSIPFFIVGIFIPNIGGEYYIKLMVMTVLVDLSSSFFPMPGGTGLNEISFTAAFGGVIGSLKDVGYLTESTGILIWVLLIWRFFSYYVYLLQGVCILSYDMAYGNRKYKWLVVKQNLAEESEAFKQNQINKFRFERAKRRKSKQKNEGNREYL
jgi:hypothetical protein